MGPFKTLDLNVRDRTALSNQLYYSTDNRTSQLSTLSGNYEEGQFLGKIKLSQNNTRLTGVGNNWSSRQSNRAWWDIAMSSNGKYMTATSESGIFTSSNFGETWIQTALIGFHPTIAMSSDGKYQISPQSAGPVYISKDYGKTWSIISGLSNPGDWYGVDISSDGKYQSVVDFASKIYISSDFGETWVETGVFSDWTGISMSSDGRYQTASTYAGGTVYVSSDYGKTWTTKLTGLNNTYSFCKVSSDGKYQIVATENDRLYISSNYGDTWTPKDTIRGWFDVTMTADGRIQAATTSSNGFVYISEDYGNTWTAKKDLADARYGIAISADGKYLATTQYTEKIYISKTDELIDGNLTIAGRVSSTEGTSQQWSSVFTTTQSNSAFWQASTTVVQANSAVWTPEELAIAYAVAL